jgi:hypothetical protein
VPDQLRLPAGTASTVRMVGAHFRRNSSAVSHQVPGPSAARYCTIVGVAPQLISEFPICLLTDQALPGPRELCMLNNWRGLMRLVLVCVPLQVVRTRTAMRLLQGETISGSAVADTGNEGWCVVDFGRRDIPQAGSINLHATFSYGVGTHSTVFRDRESA